MELKTLKQQFEDFMDNTGESRRLCERDRDYKDHKQWTAQEVAVLKKRGQAPVVNNRIMKKLMFLVGIEIRSRTDPKTYPRNPKHEQDADAITDALRYVQDNGRLDRLFSEAADEYFCEGTEAVIVEVSGPRKEIKPRRIPWDRFYYDPHSREPDFSDAKFMGVTTWLDREDVERMFPKKKKQIKNLAETTSLDSSFEDRPKWYDRVGNKRNRIRVNEHYFQEGGEWKLVFFTGDLFLTDAMPSPYLDDEGAPMCPIEAESAYVDRENNRYGVIRGDIWLQDEINHRRSKALHMLSNVTVIRGKGVVKSGATVLDQLVSGKADIELLDPDGRFEIDRNQELAQGQVALYQDAKAELDDSVVQSAGSQGTESGRSKLVDRENDIDELAMLFERHKDFKNRVYRQVWCRIKQFWDEERWVRVTDDENNIKFVGLNKQITGRDVIAEKYGIQVSEVDQFLSEQGATMMPGQLERVVGIENQVSEIDVDVILDEAPDVVSIQQEQFEVMAQLAQAYGPENVPFEEVLKLSSLRNKGQFLERVKGNPEQQQAAQAQAQQLQQAAMQMDMQEKQSKTALNVSGARKNNAMADQAQIETQLALAGVEKIG